MSYLVFVLQSTFAYSCVLRSVDFSTTVTTFFSLLISCEHLNIELNIVYLEKVCLRITCRAKETTLTICPRVAVAVFLLVHASSMGFVSFLSF